MALELKIEELSRDRATHISTFIDITGGFDVSINPGGYGTPNPDRATLALVLSATRVGGAEFIQWSDPLTDTEFAFDSVSDGVYDVRLCSIEFEAGAFDPTIMALGRVFYSVLDDEVYKVVEEEGVQVAQETTDVLANSLDASSELFYLIKSRMETNLIDIYGSSAPTQLRREYDDLRRVLSSVDCHFDQTHYREINKVIDFAVKIKIVTQANPTLL